MLMLMLSRLFRENLAQGGDFLGSGIGDSLFPPLLLISTSSRHFQRVAMVTSTLSDADRGVLSALW